MTREDQREREERAYKRTLERSERRRTMLIVGVKDLLNILEAPIRHPMFDEDGRRGYMRVAEQTLRGIERIFNEREEENDVG